MKYRNGVTQQTTFGGIYNGYFLKQTDLGKNWLVFQDKHEEIAPEGDSTTKKLI